jgi:hypothetical protein
MDTADQKSDWAGSISEWWNYSQDSVGDSLYTVLLTGPSGNDAGREIFPGPANITLLRYNLNLSYSGCPH